jgi:hypothetical protein
VRADEWRVSRALQIKEIAHAIQQHSWLLERLCVDGHILIAVFDLLYELPL